MSIVHQSHLSARSSWPVGRLQLIERDAVDNSRSSDSCDLIAESAPLTEIMIRREAQIRCIRIGKVIATIKDFDAAVRELHNVDQSIIGIDCASGDLDELQRITIRVAIVSKGIDDDCTSINNDETGVREGRAIQGVGNHATQGIVLRAVQHIDHSIHNDAAAVHAGMLCPNPG
jgi:hypothetical protein